MHEVQLDQSGRKTIVTFHANTLEVFLTTANGGISYHVGHLKSIELNPDKKGAYNLVVKNEYRTIIEAEVSEQAIPKTRDLVAAVQEAMKTIKL